VVVMRQHCALIIAGTLLALAVADPGAETIDCAAMKTKQLRVFLNERGLQCEGCAEKADFVRMCNANLDAPKIQRVAPATAVPPKPDKEQSIEELLASMKGMPGMEGIKMFNAGDLKGMNPEQMGSAFGGGKSKPLGRSDYRKELVDFYTRYELLDKLATVDAALDKWAGREEKMMTALHKKYDAEIKAYWDKQDAERASETKEEL